jgi:hypothetical protein
MDRIRSGLLQPPSGGGNKRHNLTLFEGTHQAAFRVDAGSGVQLSPHPFHVTEGPNDENRSGWHGDRIFCDIDGKIDQIIQATFFQSNNGKTLVLTRWQNSGEVLVGQN